MTSVSVDVINMYPSIKLVTIKKAVRFFTRKLTSDQENNQPLFGSHPIWYEFNPHLLSRVVLQIPWGSERRTRISDRWIQICIPGGSSRLLPFRKIQTNFPPNNLPRHLSICQPGGFHRKEEVKWD